MAVPGPKFGGDSRICAHTLCECGGPLLFSGSGRTVCGNGEFYTGLSQPGIPAGCKEYPAFYPGVHPCADGLFTVGFHPYDGSCGQPEPV